MSFHLSFYAQIVQFKTMKGAPRSDQFDDVYFSVDDGLAETRHVFMQGNGLPDFWQEKHKQEKSDFVIAETGFGTGLNFLCAWKEFVETAAPTQRLDFISFEKFPLSVDEIQKALAPWEAELRAYTKKLIDYYPLRIGGFHRIVFDNRVVLTLIFGDVNEYIPELEARVDCWFLDGFTPAKNPTMWRETLFTHMARLSSANARFATFTAAGDVKRGLQAAGFTVRKTSGFGRKRDMLVGSYDHACQTAQPSKCPLKIAIIGGGLAGTACAYALTQYGFEPIIYEASDRLASGASGNAIGLFNPRFRAQKDADAEFYASAYAQLIRTAQSIEGIDFASKGTLHLINNETKETRFAKTIASWDWHEDHMQFLNQDEASAIAGVPLDYNALFLPDAGALCPAKLCAAYARDIDVRLHQKIERLSEIDADSYVLANAIGVKDLVDPALADIGGLPVHTVRGQVTLVDGDERLNALKTNICYGGYVSTNQSGQQVIGSTFKKWVDHADVIDDENQENITLLKEAIPALSDAPLRVQEARAGLRVSSKDHFPIVGAAPLMKNVYLACAFGSHGLVGSIAAGHLIADQLRGGPYSLPRSTITQLHGQRFISKLEKTQ